MPYLTLSILIPIVAGLLILALGRDDRLPAIRMLAIVGSVLGFLVTIPLYTKFNIALGIEDGQQIIELENQSDVPCAPTSQLAIRHFIDALARDGHCAARRTVEATDQI